MKKRIIALLLFAAFAVGALAACNNGNTEISAGGSQSEGRDESAAKSVNPESAWKDANGNWTIKQEVKDFKNRTFTICVRGSSVGTYQSDDFTTDGTLYGDTLNEAVNIRNNFVSDTYNVDLVVDKNDNYMNAIRNDIETLTGNYDAIMPALSELAVLAGEGKLYELTSIPGFDISAPWYDSHATSAFSIQNKVYFTTGDITILNKVCAPSILFNKEMIKSYHLDDPYQLVNDHQWTFDKLQQMAKAVVDLSSTDVYENTYGMLTEYNNPFDFFGAAGELITVKDENDLPVLNLGGERSISLAEKILDVYANGDDWLIFGQDSRFQGFSNSLKLFGTGHALFRPSGFSAATKLRKSSDVMFGILPYPLMDSTQDDYISYCGSSSDVAGIAIPLTAKDPEFSAYMIDAYSASAKNYITHAYYDVNLRWKETYDNDSIAMLELIFSHIVYDMGEAFDFGGVTTVFKELTAARSSNIVSRLDGIIDKAKIEIAELREQYAD